MLCCLNFSDIEQRATKKCWKPLKPQRHVESAKRNTICRIWAHGIQQQIHDEYDMCILRAKVVPSPIFCVFMDLGLQEIASI